MGCSASINKADFRSNTRRRNNKYNESNRNNIGKMVTEKEGDFNLYQKINFKIDDKRSSSHKKDKNGVILIRNKNLKIENNKKNASISKERKEKEAHKYKEEKGKLEKENKKFKENINLLYEYLDKIEKLKKENKEINCSSKEKIYDILQKINKVLERSKELKEIVLQLQKYYEDLQTKYKEIIEKSELLEKENKKLNEENLLLRKIPILVGLNNIGATCYMNATLQCLSNTDELTKYFLSKFKYDESDNNKIISNAYYNVIKNLWNKNLNNKSFSPDEFKEKLSKENPLFAGVTANDSKDLINFLLERFHKELNKIKKENNYMSNEINIVDQLNEQKMLNVFSNEFRIKYNSIISNLFYGTLETKSQCQICKNIKYNFQIFSFIEFPLEKVNQYCFNSGKRNNYNKFNNKNPDIDLYECFEYYNNLDLMTGENQMYCNKCNCTCNSLYGTILYSTPNYLIINLNRGRGAIYECKVNFPEQLNLFNYVSFKMGNTVYELYAVICHIGPSSMSGHFIAFCKNKIDKKWYKYNDAFVTLCQNQNEYNIGMPYILFYKVLLSS